MKIIVLAMLTVSATYGVAKAASSNPDAALTARCKASESADFSGIQDAPTQVTEANLVEAKGDGLAYCLVKGYIWPNVGIEMGLPLSWNGKFMELGCGGHCGVLPDNEGFPWKCGAELRKGYACIVSDMGHQGTMLDGLWAYNNLLAKIDWGFRATHVVALAGKGLTEYYYNKPPSQSYFIGGSIGGRQGLQEAQRFPRDFDGIVAIVPPIDLSTLYITLAWGIHALHDQNGKPVLGQEDLKLLTDAAVAKCDMDDGVKDGVIGDPLHCAFDPAELTCKAHQTSGCLSPIQVEAVKKVYSGPLNSKGQKLSLGGPLVGSEWYKDPEHGWGASYIGAGGKPPSYEKFATDGFRYLFFWPDPGPTWKLNLFDFDHDSLRIGIMQAIYDSSNPDLRRFGAAGGKLLVFQGLNESVVLPRQTIDYYETVERTMGGRRATQSFFRLFVLPGVDYHSAGPGADTVDYLSALEDWVEKGQAPDRLIAARVDSDQFMATHDLKSESFMTEFERFQHNPKNIKFTRPNYPYPIRARYKGHGDPNDAANFGPIGR